MEVGCVNSHSLTQQGRHRAARAAKKRLKTPKTLKMSLKKSNAWRFFNIQTHVQNF